MLRFFYGNHSQIIVLFTRQYCPLRNSVSMDAYELVVKLRIVFNGIWNLYVKISRFKSDIVFSFHHLRL